MFSTKIAAFPARARVSQVQRMPFVARKIKHWKPENRNNTVTEQQATNWPPGGNSELQNGIFHTALLSLRPKGLINCLQGTGSVS